MNLFWRSFRRHTAQPSANGRVRAIDGTEAAWVHSALAMNNGTYFMSRANRWTAFDINLRPYGMPVSKAGCVLETNAYLNGPEREIGCVALAATDPDHRQTGYAEAVMRHALGNARLYRQMNIRARRGACTLRPEAALEVCRARWRSCFR